MALLFPIINKDDFSKVSKNEIIDKLASILFHDYDNAEDKVSSIHLFAIKYAPVIIERKISSNELVEKSNIKNSYFAEINKGLNIYKSLIKHGKESTIVNINSKSSPHTSPKQIIFYGVPGCGKSYKISELLEDNKIFNIMSEEQVIRTVFHPDYTNSDFIGQILPEVNETKIEYKFKAGPFTEILTRALLHPENQYVLIIEEINRGNAASIFGEIFQLLDRIESDEISKTDVNTYTKGWSEYFFMNDSINEYIRKIASQSKGDGTLSSVDISGINFSIETGIRLPPNLSLLATMNTSDQNVYTLDNAFQRRWNMEYISNNVEINDNTPDVVKKQFNSKIGDTNISWGKFRSIVNKEILNSENSFSNAEDKQLGLFFIKANNGKIEEKDFSNKVLKYLWNDIFKRDKSVFNEKISTFGDLLDSFSGVDAFNNSFSSNFVLEVNK